MEQTFAASARRLAGAAGRTLGWPPHWFWSATPAELAAILCDTELGQASGMDRRTLDRLIEEDGNGR